jgi:hypothetical protein
MDFYYNYLSLSHTGSALYMYSTRLAYKGALNNIGLQFASYTLKNREQLYTLYKDKTVVPIYTNPQGVHLHHYKQYTNTPFYSLLLPFTPFSLVLFHECIY